MSDVIKEHDKFKQRKNMQGNSSLRMKPWETISCFKFKSSL